MIKAKYVHHLIVFLEYLLLIVNAIIAFRLVILYIDINSFIDQETGRISALGRNIKFFQMVTENLTDPIINPFKNILTDILGKSNLGLVNILSPAFVIVMLLLVIVILKVISPVLMKYLRRLEEN